MRVPALVVMVLAWCSGAAAEQRYAVTIGHNTGARTDAPLAWAEDDARRFGEALRTVGGFHAEDVVSLASPNAAEVRRVLVSMNDRLRAAPDAVLVVYYSGHASSSALHLGGEELPLAELEQLVRGSSARFRVLIVDACRSGALTRVKGGKVSAAYELATTPVEGYAILTAASAEEEALESETLRGSFFTHFLISGLRGAADTDGDTQITLDEAYKYAFDATVLSSSQTLAGTQHPTYRYDLRGKGELVLSNVGQLQFTMLSFQEPWDFLVFDREMRVVGEVSATAPNRNLVVPAGELFVRARAPDGVYEGSVVVEPQQTRTLSTRELEKQAYARLVRKGAGDRQASVSPAVTLGLGSGGNDGVVWVARANVPVTLRALAIGGALVFTSGINDYIGFIPNQNLLAELVLTNAWDLPWFAVTASSYFGGGIRSAYGELGGGPAVGLGLGLDVPLLAPVSAVGDCSGRLALMFMPETTESVGLLTCSMGVSASF